MESSLEGRSADERTHAASGDGGEMSDQDGGGGGGGGRLFGILGFIGIIIALNVLSMVFDWGWYFY
jgi:hypothetical protein